MKGLGRSIMASVHVRVIVPDSPQERVEQCRKDPLRCGGIQEKDVGKGEF